MATKLTRITQNQFASTAGSNQIGVFGSFAANDPTTTTSPATAQSLSNWLDGWYGAVDGENSPCIEDMNAVHFVYAYQLAYLMQQGIPEWDSGTEYFIGSLVNDGSGNIYVSLTNSNLNNALTSSTNWAIKVGTNGFTTVTSNTAISYIVGFLRSNSTTGALTHTLPSIASTPIGTKITIKDVGTGGYTTTVQGSGSDLIDGNNVYSSALNEYDSLTLYCNGTSWDVI